MHEMTGNYNAHSSVQLNIIDTTKSFIEQDIDTLDITRFLIADFGSVHGLDSIYAMKIIIQALKDTKKIHDDSSILVVHNDLSTNNWTNLFELLNQKKFYYGIASGRSSL
ncbi:unnamed protein product [Rotaria sp. Silwood2]|nr:unnamed protein product [Rotaria sp. Silwood2]CAF3925938.1 unnamed protein product [Rotaria sp. Silwood2]